MSAVPIVLIGLGLILLVLSPLFFRTGGIRHGASGKGKKHAPSTRPSRRSRKADPQSPDPARQRLEDEKERLIQALRELEDERVAGRIPNAEYDELKTKYEAEAAAVFRQLDATAPSAQRPARKASGPVVDESPGPVWQRALAWSGVVVAFIGLAGFALMTAVQPRAEGTPMTGIPLGGETGGMGGGDMMFGLIGAMARAAGTVDSAALPSLEARVATNSSDVEALVQAGHLYLAEQRFPEAVEVTMKALELEHGNMEAHTHGALLFVAQGEADMASEVLRQVLTVRPDFAEALLYQGMVQLAQGGDPSASWERFLELAPPTANTDRIRNMLAAVKARQQ